MDLTDSKSPCGQIMSNPSGWVLITGLWNPKFFVSGSAATCEVGVGAVERWLRLRCFYGQLSTEFPLGALKKSSGLGGKTKYSICIYIYIYIGVCVCDYNRLLMYSYSILQQIMHFCRSIHRLSSMLGDERSYVPLPLYVGWFIIGWEGHRRSEDHNFWEVPF